ncbi:MULTISPECIES: SDR family oxidoreductase [Streptomyces]|uniref:SDR family oxidoreductase n=1 Tax=Streptomyces TaxID=1883 RepID=UPI0031391554
MQVAPTRTETTAQTEENLQRLAAQAPAGRPAAAAEIAAAIVYLADDETSSFVQGAVVPVDGGRVAV